MSHHRPKKALGQHFLTDVAMIGRMVEAIAPKPSDHIVEIGPGLGALTLPLMQSDAGCLSVVELDADCLSALKPKLNNDVECLHTDALSVAFDRWHHPIRLAGNLPYQISSPFLFHCLAQLDCIIDMHFLLQKEVVDRMAASPGSRTYGRLSVMVQRSCRVHFLYEVPPSAFSPPPKVDSAVCRLLPRTDLLPKQLQHRFAVIVQTAFAHKRKQLGNRLGDLGIDRVALQSMDIDPSLRPEALSVDQYDRLAHFSWQKQPD